MEFVTQSIRFRPTSPVGLLLGVAMFAPGCGSGEQAGSSSDSGPNAASGGSAGVTNTASGGGSSTAGVNEGSAELQFLTEYAAAVCAMYRPCCEREGMGYDDTGCTEWFRDVTSAYFQGEFAPEAGEACLSALAEARAADGNRCASVPRFDDATFRELCRVAFRTPARQGAELGGDCLLASDCASADVEQGSVICYGGTCVLERRGQAGDGPCNVGGSDGLPTEVVDCRPADDLYCHRGDNVCSPRVEDGEPCPYPTACKETALCTGGICQTLPDVGEACLNGVPGAGGFCRSGSACDPGTLVCGPGLEVGAACREPAQCSSGLCDDGECISSDFASKLNCTG